MVQYSTYVRASTDCRVTDPSKPVRIYCTKDEASQICEPITVPDLFKRTVAKYPNHTALMHKDERSKEWNPITYLQYQERVEKIAKVFIKLGLERYGVVAVLAFNSVEWFISELAAIHAGGLITGVYTTNSVEATKYVLENSRANIVVVDEAKQMEKIHEIKDQLPHLKAVVQTLPPYATYVKKNDGYWRWSELEEMNTDDVEDEYRKRSLDIVANECCSLVYTSGTTGFPKGVMLSHDNLVFDAHGVVAHLKVVQMGSEVIISYLPLSHIAGQLVDIVLAITIGATVYFADKYALKGSLNKTFIEARPTLFVGVPRVYEKIHEKMVAVESQSGLLKRIIRSWAKKVALQYYMAGRPSNSVQYKIANKLILSKLKYALGFDRCRIFLTAAAPMSPDTKRFFMSLGMCLIEAYGMSETTGGHTGSSLDATFGTVGTGLVGTETKFINLDSKGHGEICMRGRNVFMGYLGDEAKTLETIDDEGWLHSGDIGYADEHGQIFLTGRIKELIITAGGENIPPIHIENLVKAECAALSNAFLIGDKRKFLTMLVSLKTEMGPDGKPLDNLTPETLKWLQTMELNYTKLSEIIAAGPDPKVMKEIQDSIARANKNAISNAQKVQKFAILPRDFSIENGELSPTLKLKRNVVIDMYKDIIEKLYN